MKDNSGTLSVTCEKCGKSKTYSNKYNAKYAKQKGACASCSRKEANKLLWKDEEFRKRRGAAATNRWKKFWEVPENKEKLSKRTSEMNIRNWQNSEYREANSLKLLSSSLTPNMNNFMGYFEGSLFRSLKELKFMIEMKALNKAWTSCECSDYSIPYSFKGKMYTYYPDFRVGNDIYEIKPANRFNNEIVVAKKEAATKWCESRGLAYIIKDPGTLKSQDLEKMIDEGVVKLLRRA